VITDITFGQFFPGKSTVHRTDPRVKLCMTIFLIVLLFCSGNFASLAVTVASILALMLLSKVPMRLYLKSLKPILFIVLFTSALNMFYGTGTPIFELGFLTVTINGVMNAIFLSVRIMALILCSSILTFTTSPTELTDAIERLLKPLSYIKVPVHEFAMVMTIALRFIPTLLEETDKIMSAQKARGSDMESGGIVQRVKALVPILIPLFVSAFRRAFELATAMESRCYHGGKGRTKMKQLKLGGIDLAAVLLGVLALVAVIALNTLLPPSIVI